MNVIQTIAVKKPSGAWSSIDEALAEIESQTVNRPFYSVFAAEVDAGNVERSGVVLDTDGTKLLFIRSWISQELLDAYNTRNESALAEYRAPMIAAGYEISEEVQ